MLTQRIAKQWTISVNYLNFLVLDQNHDLSWIRNENATYVAFKQALYLVKTRG